MQRKDFILKLMLLGMSVPLMGSRLASSHRKKDPRKKILIVGAGAAGLSAAYYLKRLGVSYQILEASHRPGGRIKKEEQWLSFPLDLGAEWIHCEPKELNRILERPATADFGMDIMDYAPKDLRAWHKGKLRRHRWLSYFYKEWKFKSETWFDFFNRFILPAVEGDIHYQQVVERVQYGAEGVLLRTRSGEQFQADQVLITASVKVLQQGLITFEPPMPADWQGALQRVYMGDGLKIFLRFREKFYPDMLAFGRILEAFEAEEKFVYDAAWGKESKEAIVGLFAINDKAKDYLAYGKPEAMVERVLRELEEIFGEQVREHYIDYRLQNWSAEPFIQGAYSYSIDGSKELVIEQLSQAIEDKVFFAGEALDLESQSTVHGACASARKAVVRMVGKEGWGS